MQLVPMGPKYTNRMHFSAGLSRKQGKITLILGIGALSLSILTAAKFFFWVATDIANPTVWNDPAKNWMWMLGSVIISFVAACITANFYFVGAFSGNSGYYETVQSRFAEPNTEKTNKLWAQPDGILFFVWYHLGNGALLGTGLFMVITNISGLMTLEHPSSYAGWAFLLGINICVSILLDYAAVTFIIQSAHMVEHAEFWEKYQKLAHVQIIPESEFEPVIMTKMPDGTLEEAAQVKPIPQRRTRSAVTGQYKVIDSDINEEVNEILRRNEI